MISNLILLIVIIITAASCSTAYKSGQTPDDLYYAKAKPTINNKERYERRDVTTDEREIRMAVYDKRWRDLDYSYDYDYRYNPYSYGYNYGYYYNPYYYPYPVYSGAVTFVNPKNTTIRTTNLSSYTGNITTNSSTKSTSAVRGISIGRFNNINVTRGKNNSYENRSSTDRTYTPPPTNSNTNSTPAPTPAASGSISRPSRGN